MLSKATRSTHYQYVNNWGWGVVVTITAVDEEISTFIAHSFTYGTTFSHSDHQEDFYYFILTKLTRLLLVVHKYFHNS